MARVAEHDVNHEAEASNSRPRMQVRYSLSPAPKRQRRRRDVNAEFQEGSIIPIFPDDIALCILARLPRYLQLRRRLICRSWRHAMEPARMSSIRKALNIHEVWPIFASMRYRRNRVEFTVVDPIRRRRCKIPWPSQLLDFEITMVGAVESKLFIAAVRKWRFSHSVRDKSTDPMQGVYCFDGLSMKWQESVYASLLTARFKIVVAADMDGGYLYVAGDLCNSFTLPDPQAVERLDIKTRRWEALPDPHVKRVEAMGVVMGGIFIMIGGKQYVGDGVSSVGSVLLSCGEIWDPTTREWSLVPELWPRQVFYSDSPAKDRVVAVGDRLYALRKVSGCTSEELMYYEISASKRSIWMSQGIVPFIDSPAADRNHKAGPLKLLKMGEELWVIDWSNWVCVATKLSTLYSKQLPLCWRTLPPSDFKRSLPLIRGDMVAELHV